MLWTRWKWFMAVVEAVRNLNVGKSGLFVGYVAQLGSCVSR